jgi:hypothetical protein
MFFISFFVCFAQCVSVSSFTVTCLYMESKNSVSDLHLHLHCFYIAKNYLHGFTLTRFKFVNYTYMFCDPTLALT